MQPVVEVIVRHVISKLRAGISWQWPAGDGWLSVGNDRELFAQPERLYFDDLPVEERAVSLATTRLLDAIGVAGSSRAESRWIGEARVEWDPVFTNNKAE